MKGKNLLCLLVKLQGVRRRRRDRERLVMDLTGRLYISFSLSIFDNSICLAWTPL
jgi:hypothetical protein